MKNEDFSRCYKGERIYEAKISVRHDKYYEYYEYAMDKASDRYVIRVYPVFGRFDGKLLVEIRKALREIKI